MTYERVPGSPIHQLREEFLRSTRDPATASDGIKLVDEMVAMIATIDREDARRFIKLVRDLLEIVGPAVERQE